MCFLSEIYEWCYEGVKKTIETGKIDSEII